LQAAGYISGAVAGGAYVLYDGLEPIEKK